MPPQPAISDTSITRAVEITKAALACHSTTSWVNSGDTVATFLDKVATKLEELRDRQSPQR